MATILTRGTRLGRASFELYLMFLCVLSGVTGLFVPAARSKSIVAAFPEWAQIGWYGGLATAGMIAAAGILHSDILGQLIERAAMLILAGMCASFGAAAIAYAGPPAVTGAIPLFGFVIPCFVRARQITADLAAVRTELRLRRTMTGEYPAVQNEQL